MQWYLRAAINGHFHAQYIVYEYIMNKLKGCSFAFETVEKIDVVTFKQVNEILFKDNDKNVNQLLYNIAYYFLELSAKQRHKKSLVEIACVFYAHEVELVIQLYKEAVKPQFDRILLKGERKAEKFAYDQLKKHG